MKKSLHDGKARGLKGFGRRAAVLLLCLLLAVSGLSGALSAAAKEAWEFPDVSEAAWYYPSLSRILEERPGTIDGMGDGSFQPSGTTTRAQFVKMLCSFSGDSAKEDFLPEYGNGSGFSDVSGWSAPYVDWASRSGIVSGISPERFAPGNSITRQEIASILCRYHQMRSGYRASYLSDALSGFSDAASVSSWASVSMKWAVSNGIVNGYSGGRLGPRGNATRAEVVAMLCNYLDLMQVYEAQGADYDRREGAWIVGEEPEVPEPPEEKPWFEPRWTEKNGATVIDAPFIDQRVKYPTGCESVSAVMALQYFGVDISVERFIDNYLPRGNAPHYNASGQYVCCDPELAFPGNPYSTSGWGCYAPVITGCLNRIVDSGKLDVRELHGESLDSLCGQYVDKGIPVILWATVGMQPPVTDSVCLIEGTNRRFVWLYPMHCLLLVGRDSTSYYFNDPMSGKCARYSKSAVERAYSGISKQAIVLLPK